MPTADGAASAKSSRAQHAPRKSTDSVNKRAQDSTTAKGLPSVRGNFPLPAGKTLLQVPDWQRKKNEGETYSQGATCIKLDARADTLTRAASDRGMLSKVQEKRTGQTASQDLPGMREPNLQAPKAELEASGMFLHAEHMRELYTEALRQAPSSANLNDIHLRREV